MSRNAFKQTLVASVWILIGIVFNASGCSWRLASDPATQEPSFFEQVQSVQRGLTHEIYSKQKVTDVEFALLKDLAELETLSLLNAFLTDEADEVLASLVGLRRLRLEKASLRDRSAKAIGCLSKLTTINLPDAKISNQGIEKWLSLSELILLRIGSPNLTDPSLETIGKMSHLRFLHLIEIPITDLGLKFLYEMKQLESFYLDGSLSTDHGLSELLEALPELHFHRDQQHIPRDRRADDHTSHSFPLDAASCYTSASIDDYSRLSLKHASSTNRAS